MLLHSHTLSLLYFSCSSSWHVMYDVQCAYSEETLFPLLLEKVPSPALCFLYSQVQNNFQYPSFWGIPNLEILKFYWTTPTKVLPPPLINWMLQDLDTWNSFSLFSWCEFVLFDQGFKLYPVPAPKEVPLCFATLLSIPFTSENSSSMQLLITFLFTTTASHYSSPWLGDEPAHTSFSPPVPDLGGQAPSLYSKFLFAPKARVASIPYHQILFHFYTSGSLASFWATVLFSPTLAMLLNSSPVPTFISTCILCWGC